MTNTIYELKENISAKQAEANFHKLIYKLWDSGLSKKGEESMLCMEIIPCHKEKFIVSIELQNRNI